LGDVKFLEEREIQVSADSIPIDSHFQEQVDSYEKQKRSISGDYLLIRNPKEQRYCDMNDLNYTEDSEDNEGDAEILQIFKRRIASIAEYKLCAN